MHFIYKLDSLNINVELKKRRGIKHCYLRIKENNLLQISANSYFTLDDAKKLIEKKRNWIEKHFSNKISNLDDDSFYYLGKIYKKTSNDFDLINFYKEKANEILPFVVDDKAELMKLYPSSLKFRNNKTRWGSCSFKNGIILNTNLMKFPIKVIEYVVIHELAHIMHKNHSKQFWSLVEKYCPNYKELEIELKKL